MTDDSAKAYLHSYLRDARTALVGKLDGLDEYAVRRPMTSTGTNLLGLVKHVTMSEARYLGDALGRPFPERLPWWDDDAEPESDMWATAAESRAGIVDRYRRACEHADATIAALDLDAPGHVPWWPQPDTTLFKVIVHVLTETNRHAGHADILREHLDGVVGQFAPDGRGAAYWSTHRARVEEAALRAGATPQPGPSRDARS
ncbi:DinB family protein [Pseudonocardia sp. CA-107938]|uniref:DinB family protein n=1 Tax=Pseudonocardia sp. CA-107938 TaxID=3240021 RepID=UPI003D8A1584